MPEVSTTLRDLWLTSQKAMAGFRHQRHICVAQDGPSPSSFSSSPCIELRHTPSLKHSLSEINQGIAKVIH